jgi:hypothetical protein
MKTMKLQMFNSAGEVNKVLNDFAEFILNRKSLSEATEKKFVLKLQSLSGTTNSPMSLLQRRIDKSEIDYKKSIWGRGIIDEMKDAIKRHSK